MAENGQTQASYIDTLQMALLARKEWLEKEEMGKLKEDLRNFHTSFVSLYNIYLKRKLIDEDPYKHEVKINELEIPDTGPILEAKRIEQLSIRLAAYDNQLDFLVNFYQLNIDYLSLDRIRRINGLVRYIEWTSLTPDSNSPITKAVAELTMSSKTAGVDSITINIITEGLKRLSKATVNIMGILKNLSVYYRESYKLDIRQKITQEMSQSDATLENIRKKMQAQMQGSPFYKELIEEIIREDFSADGQELKDAVLSSLKIKEDKPKVVKPAVNFKVILLDGIIAIGNAAIPLGEICSKLDENQTTMESYKKGFFEKLKELLRQLAKAEPEPVIYNVEYMDPIKGVPVKERVNFHLLREELAKKCKILNSFVRGPAYQKISAMTEEQIIGYLDRNIKDVQNYHRVLGSLDDYFKANVAAENREKIKGIKPELSALKNTIVKANQLRHDYTALKEEEDQLRRLGINPAVVSGGIAGTAAPTEAAPAAPAPPA